MEPGQGHLPCDTAAARRWKGKAATPTPPGPAPNGRTPTGPPTGSGNATSASPARTPTAGRARPAGSASRCRGPAKSLPRTRHCMSRSPARSGSGKSRRTESSWRWATGSSPKAATTTPPAPVPSGVTRTGRPTGYGSASLDIGGDDADGSPGKASWGQTKVSRVTPVEVESFPGER